MQKILLVMLTLPLSLALMGFSKEPTNYEEERVDKSYYMPLEDEEHEGTWIQWPHSYTYGRAYQRGIEDIWVKMTKALTKGEKVHIVAYNETEKKAIERLLNSENVDMNFVDFYIYPTDDVWVRDNGPLWS